MGVSKLEILLVFLITIGLTVLGLTIGSSTSAEPVVQQNIAEIPAESPQDSENNDFDNLLAALSGEAEELPSPCNRIKEDQIFVFQNQIIIDLKNAEWATFTDTNSMDPVIDAGANAIEIVPDSEEDICLGDIVSYRSKYADGIMIHRVVEIGDDSNGWYAIMRGDNNPYNDPGRIRFNQIERVVVAIIY